MTTLESAATLVANARRRAVGTERIAPALQLVLALLAAVLFTVAAWMLSAPAGLAVAGLSCLVAEHRIAHRGDRPGS